MPQKTKNITYLLSLISVFIASFFISNPALAEEAGNSGFLGFDTSSPCAYWQSLFNFGMIAASILAVAMLVLGGIYYMTSLGQEDRIGNAKNIMTGAIVGFLIAISSWLIFNVLSPTLLECNLEVPEINVHYEESSGGNTESESSNPCAGVHEEDLFDSREECMEDWDGTCQQQEISNTSSSSSGGSGRSCTNTEDCLSGETCEGANDEAGVSGICTSGEEDESSNQVRWCRRPPPSGLYEDMMSVCTSTSSQENYRTIINHWRNILPNQAVYVGGGYMSGNTCHASSSNSYLERKLQSGDSYRSEWVDPAGGDINQAVSNYRAWAEGLGGRYCGDCLTFSKELYNCAGSSTNVISIKENRDSADHYFRHASEFVAAVGDGSLDISPGSFIWLGDGCEHALNYTGISGAEIIEMGGGNGPVTFNGHSASTVGVTSSLESRIARYRNQDCPVYIHNVID